MKRKNHFFLSLTSSKRTPVRCPLLFLAPLLFLVNTEVSAQKNKPGPLVVLQGKIQYNPDSLGNRIPDFSWCGYAASEQAIPDITVKAVVPLKQGDATRSIQTAIDYVSSLPLDENGFRGAVLLQKGTYAVSGQLKIMASGVVLRGSGSANNGTIILGTGNGRETLIRVFGKNDRRTSEPILIADAYVPVNANSITVSTTANLKSGDLILIRRPSTLNWIKLLGTDHFGGGVTALGWKPGERDLFFERTITSIHNNNIAFDVPLTTALDSSFGKSTITLLNWPGRISHCGIENLSLQSTYDIKNPKDEAHRWMAITMENISDAWVRQVNFKHFAGSAVAILETAKKITVEDCKSLAPVSEIGGQRRNTFFTMGQQTLIQRCYAENGYHDFATGFCAAGPNAFVQCQSSRPYSFSGTIESWASGVLFDIVNVDGNALKLSNRGQDGQGAGWTTANSVLWQCTAAMIDCDKPPGANNYAFGSWAQFSGNGYWESSNEQIQPRSLYYAQLAARLGNEVLKRSYILPMETEASSSPPVDVAMALTKKAYTPAPTLFEWIDSVSKIKKISVDASEAWFINASLIPKTESKKIAGMKIMNGWLVKDGKILAGGRQDVQWWSGGILPTDLPKSKPHITRFVPGRTGTGLTDDLDSVTEAMKNNGVLAIEHNYGLWYERRRDDHERIRRMDGDVWAPFYELPFQRSGIDSAWDGLSKYDLTKYNSWYWSRLKKFAELADEKSLVLVHQNYFQHNIIEAGAHYADFPWRTANNINQTGFPEPVPYAGDKRIFMAEQFYDVSNPLRRKLHTAYIRQCLDNFKDQHSVIQEIGAEFTGPLHFVQFWLDVIRQWEKETGKMPIISLSTTKDVQDSILSDSKRSAIVDMIDIRYWHYQEDGSVYAPKGGQNLAPRQHARLLKPKRTSFEQVYRAVSEYKSRFPQKAVMYSGDNFDQFGWAVLMAGGSMPVLPQLDSEFLKEASQMKPFIAENIKGQWMLKSRDGCIIYADGKNPVLLSLPMGNYQVHYIHPSSGRITAAADLIAGKDQIELKNLPGGAIVIWLSLQKKSGQYETTHSE